MDDIPRAPHSRPDLSETWALVAAMEQSSRAAYRAAGKRIRQQVADYEHIGIAELAEIHRLLDSELKQLEQVQNRLLHEGMLAAAAAAALGWRGSRREPEAERLLVRHLLDTPQKDGLNLSARLWRIHAGAARDLKSVVDVAVQRGLDAEHTLQRTLNITPELKQALDEAGAGAVARCLEAGLLANPGNAAAKFRRVLRTEINRAHGATSSWRGRTRMWLGYDSCFHRAIRGWIFATSMRQRIYTGWVRACIRWTNARGRHIRIPSVTPKRCIGTKSAA